MIPYEMHKEVVFYGLILGVWFFFHHVAAWGVGGYFAVKESLRRSDININYILRIVLFAFIGSLLGARIFAFYGPWAPSCISGSFTERFMLMFSFEEKGWVAYGGMIGAFLFAYLCARFSRVSFLKYVDFTIPGIALGMSIARIGCFISGCCYGSKTSVPWAIIKNGIPIHPVQLYTSITDFGIFLLALRLNEKKEKEGRFDGYLFFSFLIAYAFARFFVEFFRGDYASSNYFYGLTSSQVISIAMFLVFAPVMIGMIIKEKRGKPVKNGFHVAPKDYITLAAGCIILNLGAYITTPMPYLGFVLIFSGLAIIVLGMRGVFKKSGSKKTKN